jgi:predicted TIM-barrel enzyme
MAGGLDGFIVETSGTLLFKPCRRARSQRMAVLVERLRGPVGPQADHQRLAQRAAATSIAAATNRFVRVNVHAVSRSPIEDAGRSGGERCDCAASSTASRDPTGRGRQALAHAAGILIGAQRPRLIERGLADGLIVTGAATGEAAPLADLRSVKSAAPGAPLFVGSGVTEATIAEALTIADGVIVGTSIKQDGDVSLPVSLARVRALVAAAGRKSA